MPTVKRQERLCPCAAASCSASTLERLIDRLVEEGRYDSASDVVREALRLLEGRETLRRLKIEGIRRSIEESRRDGRTIPEEEVFGRLEAKYEAMAREAEGPEPTGWLRGRTGRLPLSPCRRRRHTHAHE